MKFDWSKANPDTIREIVREGETYLQDQLTLAISADQRASVMASVFAAAGAAIVAGLITLVSSDRVNDFIPVFIGGAVAATLFLAGSGLCVWATLPVKFDLPGSQPKEWVEDVKAGKPLDDSLAEQAGHYQGKIEDNRKVLRQNAGRFQLGAISGIAAPFVGFLVWLFVTFYAS
ncbi:MAG: hypothetical protein IID50_07360 [Proteobacteria bacterium]|nr:hypothetical protein [Pseudomonadota bacterium]